MTIPTMHQEYIPMLIEAAKARNFLEVVEALYACHFGGTCKHEDAQDVANTLHYLAREVAPSQEVIRSYPVGSKPPQEHELLVLDDTIYITGYVEQIPNPNPTLTQLPADYYRLRIQPICEVPLSIKQELRELEALRQYRDTAKRFLALYDEMRNYPCL